CPLLLVLSLHLLRVLFSFCFFFSSRRRHTRCYRDWSSDVCSSDLHRRARPSRARARGGGGLAHGEPDLRRLGPREAAPVRRVREIGRASCRERGEMAVDGGACKKKSEEAAEEGVVGATSVLGVTYR